MLVRGDHVKKRSTSCDFFAVRTTYKKQKDFICTLFLLIQYFMRTMKLKPLLLIAFALVSLCTYGQGLKAFKLKNGLSVFVWEDNTKSDVYGMVAVRTGSVNDPEEYTFLPHESLQSLLLYPQVPGSW